MSEQTDRVRICEAMGWRWVSAEYVGRSACPADKKVRLRFVPPNYAGRDWILKDSTEAGTLSPIQQAALPRFFEDANAALQICDWMRWKGWIFELSNQPDGKWKCKIGTTTYFQWRSQADTLPAAICAAFLAFLDSEKGDGR